MPRTAFTATERRHAAVITFPAHMTKAQCDDILARMLKAGYCDPAYNGNAPTCREYDPDMSSPTLYFP